MTKFKVTASEAIRVIEANEVGKELIFSNFKTRELKRPVMVDGLELPPETTIQFDADAVAEFGENDAVGGPFELKVHETFAEIRYFAKEEHLPMLRAASSVADTQDELGEISGGVGPFVYSLDFHVDMDDITQSYFAVSLSLFGLKLCDSHLDVNNPRFTFGATVCGVGAKGTVGIDFDGGRLYLDAILEYLVGSKTITYDLYNWKNYSVSYTPSEEVEDRFNVCNALTDVGMGVISVRNVGAYIAKFTVSYHIDGHRYTKESESFTAGVTKSIEIPAGATNILVEALDAWFFGSWTVIFSEVFAEPVVKKYRVSGTTLDPSYEEIK